MKAEAESVPSLSRVHMLKMMAVVWFEGGISPITSVINLNTRDQ